MNRAYDLSCCWPLVPRALGSGWGKFDYFSEAMNMQPERADEIAPATGAAGAKNAQILPLSATQVDDRLRIVTLNCGEANNRLMGMGLIPGAVVEVISSTATGSLIVALQDQRLGLGAEMAQRIQVIDAEQPLNLTQDTLTVRMATMQTTSEPSTMKLRDAAIGAKLRVVGYEPTARDYKRKLLAMGLTPGTELQVTRLAPMGDPTQIEVRGFQLSLRKAEADALMVEFVAGN